MNKTPGLYLRRLNRYFNHDDFSILWMDDYINTIVIKRYFSNFIVSIFLGAAAGLVFHWEYINIYFTKSTSEIMVSLFVLTLLFFPFFHKRFNAEKKFNELLCLKGKSQILDLKILPVNYRELSFAIIMRRLRYINILLYSMIYIEIVTFLMSSHPNTPELMSEYKNSWFIYLVILCLLLYHLDMIIIEVLHNDLLMHIYFCRRCAAKAFKLHISMILVGFIVFMCFSSIQFAISAFGIIGGLVLCAILYIFLFAFDKRKKVRCDQINIMMKELLAEYCR